MRACIVYKKVSFDMLRDGLSAYHAALFHGRFTNKVVDDNHFGDRLSNHLILSKNAYDISPIFQPQRNLVVSSKVKDLLSKTENVDFFEVGFEKLFSLPFAKHDHSVGPDNFNKFEGWLTSFKHEESLVDQVGEYYELIIPFYGRVVNDFSGFREVVFQALKFGGERKLKLSEPMLEKYPVIWTPEGIVFRKDILDILTTEFDWDYFVRREVKF